VDEELKTFDCEHLACAKAMLTGVERYATKLAANAPPGSAAAAGSSLFRPTATQGSSLFQSTNTTGGFGGLGGSTMGMGGGFGGSSMAGGGLAKPATRPNTLAELLQQYGNVPVVKERMKLEHILWLGIDYDGLENRAYIVERIRSMYFPVESFCTMLR
jgi:hypothetical protein